MEDSPYVLLTAAKNESDFIEATMKSVVNQTLKPRKWVIINDGSTDNTAELVSRYSKENPFIHLINIEPNEKRDFASKVHAIKKGFDYVLKFEYEYIGVLDADITFDNDYYESIIKEFQSDPKLGIAGGVFFDIIDNVSVKIPKSEFSVRGAVQLFRRKCYSDIGGLKPFKFGGEDGIACVAARMNGWKVVSFDNFTVLHHRRTGTVETNILKRRFRDGIVEYNLGYIPLFQFLKCVKRIKEKPVLIGSILRLLGYWWNKLLNKKVDLPENLLEYFKSEQIQRIKNRS